MMILYIFTLDLFRENVLLCLVFIFIRFKLRSFHACVDTCTANLNCFKLLEFNKPSTHFKKQVFSSALLKCFTLRGQYEDADPFLSRKA